MLEQDRIAATVFLRDGDDWVGHIVTNETTMALPELGIELPFAELYAGAELAEQETAD